MKLKLIFCLCMLPLLCLAQESQPQQFSNRYGMKMTRNDDGSYALLYAKKYAKFIDVNTIPDVMVPYTYQADRLKSKDYKGVTTKDIVYKKHKDYELILTVDFAETEKPAPFVVYIHGGGWARGNNGSSRSLSQYLAKQKGITGVRVSYTLAPQSDATVKVSIQDILDAVKYVQEHAAELNINPDCFGFLGTSAGAHLAAVAAMTVPGTKAFVGYSGISPINLIPKKDVPASMLVCGTCDVTVECEQSEMFASALKKRGGVCDLLKYEYYDHNVSSKTSDKMEEIFFKSVDFLTNHIK